MKWRNVHLRKILEFRTQTGKNKTLIGTLCCQSCHQGHLYLKNKLKLISISGHGHGPLKHRKKKSKSTQSKIRPSTHWFWCFLYGNIRRVIYIEYFPWTYFYRICYEVRIYNTNKGKEKIYRYFLDKNRYKLVLVVHFK